MSFEARLRQVAGLVAARGVVFDVGSDSCDFDETPWLRVGDPNGVCNITGQPNPWWGRKWRLSRHMTNGEIVQTAFKALMTALEHEAREQFTYKGVAVMGPHLDIDKWAEYLQANPGMEMTR